ncbi:MAG: glycosyl hydrolase [Thermoguttaceae bacterium]|jgi:hypothetical protein
MPTVAEAAASFSQPPREYGAIHWAIWGGQQTKERIQADIERINANGGGVYMINNSRGLRPKYFTPEYLDLVKFTVEECKKNGMKVWIEGDAGYPDGFAGGMISSDYPQLGMQGIVADAHYTVAAGQTLAIPLPADTLGILTRATAAVSGAGEPSPAGTVLSLPDDGKFKWTAPAGSWEVTFQGSPGEARYSIVAGQTLSIPLPPQTKSIRANPRAAGRGGAGARGGEGTTREPAQASTVLPLPDDGQLHWTAPNSGTWEVTFVRHVYRSSPTRFVNRADGTNDKDSLYSLIDYLDPKATATYLRLIHETYQKLVGDEFGKTILGFRGDEPDYTGFMPWTARLLETFQAKKGYDLKPYIAQFFVTPLTPEAQRAKADYWDVWSGMFRDNFFKPQQDWCNARNMEYMCHLNHEEIMMSRGGGGDLIKNEGSFFRDMRYVGVPGVDNLGQIKPGVVADFPKLAGSAAHLFGRPLIWDEEGGSTGVDGKFVIDYQLVRGINYMNIRGLNRVTPAAAHEGAQSGQDPAFVTGWYVTRAQHLLAIGRPGAQVALYHPTDSYWLGDREADAVTVNLTMQLMEQQIDFDHIDHDTLATVCTLEKDGLKNLSGQVYHAVVIPTSTVIEKNVLERLRAFAAASGKVVFVGRTPTMVVSRTFLHPEADTPDLSFATLEPTEAITAKVVAALPKPDVKLNVPCTGVKYIHRMLKDGDVYFFFNESDQTQERTVTLAGNGQVQVWDAITGKINPLAGAIKAQGSSAVPLSLASHESRFIVIGPLPEAKSSPAASDI